MGYGDDIFDDDEEPFTIEGCKASTETGKALLIHFPDGTKSWIPKSQITDDSEVYESGGEGSLQVTGWFAKQRGWA